jgi:putative glutamine amidotransferase
MPVVGLNCDLATRDGESRIELWRDYALAVEAAGGTPVLLPPTRDPAHAATHLAMVQGLVLVGGRDYSPRRYGAAPHPRTVPLDPEREAYDVALARAALRARTPLLAICGGLQLVNIALGGDLMQHVPDLAGARIRHDAGRGEAAHEIAVAPGSRLAAIVGAGRLVVNSSHHQAAGRVGRGLRVAARSDDGVIEALESRAAGRFLICVQWHPERLPEVPAHRALFEALVRACRER